MGHARYGTAWIGTWLWRIVAMRGEHAPGAKAHLTLMPFERAKPKGLAYLEANRASPRQPASWLGSRSRAMFHSYDKLHEWDPVNRPGSRRGCWRNRV